MDPLWGSTIITAILVCITAYYAYEVRLTRKAGNEPVFSIRSEIIIGIDDYIVSGLRLINFGGPARDIKIDIYADTTTPVGLFYIPSIGNNHYVMLNFDVNKLRKGKRKVIVKLVYKDNIGNIIKNNLNLDIDDIQNESRTILFEKCEK
jgi:hypothetical protein